MHFNLLVWRFNGISCKTKTGDCKNDEGGKTLTVDVLLCYLAEKVIEDLRCGKHLERALLKAISIPPVIDYLRKAVRSVGSVDSDIIFNLCQSQSKGGTVFRISSASAYYF